jgi:hypothetical protein
MMMTLQLFRSPSGVGDARDLDEFAVGIRLSAFGPFYWAGQGFPRQFGNLPIFKTRRFAGSSRFGPRSIQDGSCGSGFRHAHIITAAETECP